MRQDPYEGRQRPPESSREGDMPEEQDHHDEQLTLWPVEARPGTGSAPPGAGVRGRVHTSSGTWSLASPGGALRRPWLRRSLAVVAAAGLVTAVLPGRAAAAIPVVDFAAIAEIVASIGKLTTQISIMTNQYNAFVNNTRKLTSGYAWRNINGAVAAVDGVVSSGAALSYSTAGLAGQLGATFPGYSYDPATIATDARTQKERALGTVLQQAVAAQQTWGQIGQSVTRLNQIKAQVAAITSAQQAAEVAATLGVLSAEELTLLRQQLLTATSAQAVLAAEQTNRELQGVAAVRVMFTDPAVGLRLNPPVRPPMNPAAYAF
jgi:P-type conjugative transfer protein TrbJ